jgi:gliding motility associated protien GldN
MKSNLKVLACFVFTVISFISVSGQTVLDGIYIKEHTKTTKVVGYPTLREADVMWAKRVWRVMDLQEKLNHPFYYPLEATADRKSLFDIIKTALLVDGSITAYSTGVTGQEDDFRNPLLVSDVKNILSKQDTVNTADVDTGEMIQSIQTIDVVSQDIKRYKIKEDWYFDKQRSERSVRIIGIAPMKEKITSDGESTGAYETLFWLYFPECRYVFANWEVFNRSNDSERKSYDDIFWKRQFSSYIIKESNPYDRNINMVYQGMDALLESERIKEEIFTFEHDLWSY